jgi:AraC-like DNA-binding protein
MDLRFTIPEILSLIGVAQCVYLLVYMIFRAGRLARVGLPLLYFLVLGLAFLYDFAAGYLGSEIPYYEYIRWALWFYGPPLSVLLAVQIAQITRVPDARHYWVVLLIPIAFLFSFVVGSPAGNVQEWLVVSGLVAGAVSMLAVWANMRLFKQMLEEKTGKARYWLIIALMTMNISFLVTMLFSLNTGISNHDVMLVRTVLGLGFVYIVGTGLFRLYPQAVQLELKHQQSSGPLSGPEKELALKIEKLMTMDKVYQESTYSRTDLARECNTSETVISRVINEHFGKSLPQLLNEHRIADAKRLLAETDAPVRVVAEQVGFNSLPSFNRVFKEMTGVAPSQFRKSGK